MILGNGFHSAVCFRLRQLDIEFMKRLHKKVNLVPVIAKADVLTRKETKRLKENMMKDIAVNQIEVSMNVISRCYSTLFLSTRFRCLDKLRLSRQPA